MRHAIAPSSHPPVAAQLRPTPPRCLSRFFYHSVTRESKWEVPQGTQVKFMDGTTGEAMGPKSGASAEQADDSGFGGLTALGITLFPIAIVFGGLFILHWQAR